MITAPIKRHAPAHIVSHAQSGRRRVCRVATAANGHQTAAATREARHRALLARLRALCAKHYPRSGVPRRHECKTTIDQISVLSICMAALAFGAGGGDPRGDEMRRVLALVETPMRDWDLSERTAWRMDRNVRMILRLAWRA